LGFDFNTQAFSAGPIPDIYNSTLNVGAALFPPSRHNHYHDVRSVLQATLTNYSTASSNLVYIEIYPPRSVYPCWIAIEFYSSPPPSPSFASNLTTSPPYLQPPYLLQALPSKTNDCVYTVEGFEIAHCQGTQWRK